MVRFTIRAAPNRPGGVLLPPEGSRSNVRNQTPPLAPLPGGLPPILHADLVGPIVDRRSWVGTIGPAYAGTFIWIPLLDRLGISIQGETSLAQLAVSAVLAAFACYFLLYLVPAAWGWKAGRRLSVVAASTFGTEGSEWVTGVGLGFAAILVYGVSLFMAIRLTLLGLLLCGMISPSACGTWTLGPAVLQNPVALLTCIFWIFIIGMLNRLRLVSVIVGLMKVYAPVALLLLGGTALLTASGLLTFDAVKASLPGLGQGGGVAPGSGSGKAGVFQLIFSYFAVSGLMGVDWGMAVRHERDIRIGGWLSIILAGSYCSILSLLTVAGALGILGRDPVDSRRRSDHPSHLPLGHFSRDRRYHRRSDPDALRAGNSRAGLLRGRNRRPALLDAVAGYPPGRPGSGWPVWRPSSSSEPPGLAGSSRSSGSWGRSSRPRRGRWSPIPCGRRETGPEFEAAGTRPA